MPNLRADAEAQRQAAVAATRRANDARDLADDLHRRYESLGRRLKPAVDRHRPAVWDSRAATASRLRLFISATGALGRAREDLLGVVGGLRAEAFDLDDAADRHRRQAAAFDAEASREAAAAAAASSVAPALDLSFLADLDLSGLTSGPH